MNNHTPGPWTTNGTQIFADDKQPKWIASVNRLFDEAPANARLIAAAPDMLEALRGMVDHAYYGVQAESWRRKALAALAKAEGRS